MEHNCLLSFSSVKWYVNACIFVRQHLLMLTCIFDVSHVKNTIHIESNRVNVPLVLWFRFYLCDYLKCVFLPPYRIEKERQQYKSESDDLQAQLQHYGKNKVFIINSYVYKTWSEVVFKMRNHFQPILCKCNLFKNFKYSL